MEHMCRLNLSARYVPYLWALYVGQVYVAGEHDFANHYTFSLLRLLLRIVVHVYFALVATQS